MLVHQRTGKEAVVYYPDFLHRALMKVCDVQFERTLRFRFIETLPKHHKKAPKTLNVVGVRMKEFFRLVQPEDFKALIGVFP